MNIDGHAVRIDSIDAVTEIEVRVVGVCEGTDRIARGQFDVLIRGQKLTISRSKRFETNDEPLKKVSVKEVREVLIAIRDPIIAVIA